MGERTHHTLGDRKSEQENVVPKFFGLLYFTGKSANNTERLYEIHFKRRYEKVDTLCMDEYLHSAPGNKTPDNELWVRHQFILFTVHYTLKTFKGNLRLEWRVLLRCTQLR